MYFGPANFLGTCWSGFGLVSGVVSNGATKLCDECSQAGTRATALLRPLPPFCMWSRLVKGIKENNSCCSRVTGQAKLSGT
ncbi:hypothetical protein PspLS_07520 [Pyricularia sp. CBS 133598]|nr:hypothetical protein PspLS_07520 [Pyricularia sp. CBS 133598]